MSIESYPKYRPKNLSINYFPFIKHKIMQLGWIQDFILFSKNKNLVI